jgi:hypothetical protein
MKWRAFASLLLLAPCLAVAEDRTESPASRASETAPAPEELARRADIIKPSADELNWTRIPWVLDLAEGQRLARAEKRPIFLWVTGDDPLERC